MKPIVNLIVNKYNLKEYGIDFMGYRITDSRDITFHHLIKRKKDGGKETIENGVVLTKTSHKYLHIIEKENINIYKLITMEMLEEKNKGVNVINIYNIDKLLLIFEQDYYKKYNVRVKDKFQKRFLREFDDAFLENIKKYELKKDLLA